jgi:hypothetical protein
VRCSRWRWRHGVSPPLQPPRPLPNLTLSSPELLGHAGPSPTKSRSTHWIAISSFMLPPPTPTKSRFGRQIAISSRAQPASPGTRPTWRGNSPRSGSRPCQGDANAASPTAFPQVANITGMPTARNPRHPTTRRSRHPTARNSRHPTARRSRPSENAKAPHLPWEVRCLQRQRTPCGAVDAHERQRRPCVETQGGG